MAIRFIVNFEILKWLYLAHYWVYYWVDMKSGNRPLSRGGHFESQGNKKLCFCTSSLALNERLDVQNLLFEHCVIKVYRLLYRVVAAN